MDLTTGDIGQPGIEQCGQHADQTRLGLPAQPEKDEIMPGKHGIDDLRNHCIFITDDAGKKLIAAGQCGEKVIVKFAFDQFRLPAAIAKLAEGGGFGGIFRHERFVVP